MTETSISIIVPVYNAEKHLERCVNSISQQTFQRFELILVDDGSTDNSGQICDFYTAKDTRIRVIHQANQGQATARNRAVLEARGEYICFVDADDVIHPQMIEVLHKALVDNNVKISACGAFEGKELPDSFFNKISYEANRININEEELLRLYKEKYLYWVPWGKLIKKEILLEFPFPKGRKYEDNAIVYRWLYSSDGLAVCNEELYFYYVNDSGTTKSQYSLKVMDWLQALKEQAGFYREVKYYSMLREIVPRYVREAVFQREQILDVLHNRNAAFKLKRDIILFCLRYHNYLSRYEQNQMIIKLLPTVYSLKLKIRSIIK